MRAYFVVSCLCLLNTVFATSVQQSVACDQHHEKLQPLLHDNNYLPEYVRVFQVDPSSSMQLKELAEHILYVDADLVQLKDTSINTASTLYQSLQGNYAHFIYFPHEEKGLFIASKYPLKTVGSLQEHSAICQGNEGLAPITNLDDKFGIFTASRHRRNARYLVQLPQAKESHTIGTLVIIHVARRGGGGSGGNDTGGGYGGGKISITWGGDNEVKWDMSAYGGYEDYRGNYVEIEIKSDKEGTSSASVEAGHDSD